MHVLFTLLRRFSNIEIVVAAVSSSFPTTDILLTKQH